MGSLELGSALFLSTLFLLSQQKTIFARPAGDDVVMSKREANSSDEFLLSACQLFLNSRRSLFMTFSHQPDLESLFSNAVIIQNTLGRSYQLTGGTVGFDKSSLVTVAVSLTYEDVRLLVNRFPPSSSSSDLFLLFSSTQTPQDTNKQPLGEASTPLGFSVVEYNDPSDKDSTNVVLIAIIVACLGGVILALVIVTLIIRKMKTREAQMRSLEWDVSSQPSSSNKLLLHAFAKRDYQGKTPEELTVHKGVPLMVLEGLEPSSMIHPEIRTTSFSPTLRSKPLTFSESPVPLPPISPLGVPPPPSLQVNTYKNKRSPPTQSRHIDDNEEDAYVVCQTRNGLIGFLPLSVLAFHPSSSDLKQPSSRNSLRSSFKEFVQPENLVGLISVRSRLVDLPSSIIEIIKEGDPSMQALNPQYKANTSISPAQAHPYSSSLTLNTSVTLQSEFLSDVGSYDELGDAV